MRQLPQLTYLSPLTYPLPYIVSFVCVRVCVCRVRTQELLLANFNYTMLLAIVTVLKIRFLELVNLMTIKPVTNISLSPSTSSPCQPLFYLLCFYELDFFRLDI